VSAVYLDLLARAERELALARAGRWDELASAAQDSARRAAALPATPPPAARAALERLAAVRAELHDLLAAAREETGAELRRLRQGRGAVRGYGAA